MYFWLSFCDPDKPKGSQFLGACIVESPILEAAICVAALFGCNPGGEVRIVEILPDNLGKNFTEEDMNRLISYQEIEERWGVATLE